MRLRFTTGQSEHGPTVEWRTDWMRLTYWAPSAGGGVCRVLQFGLVWAFRFTSEPLMESGMYPAGSSILEVVGSTWGAELAEATDSYLENRATEARHLVVFFDGHGCFEILTGEASNDFEMTDA